MIKAVQYRITRYEDGWRILDLKPDDDPAEVICQTDELADDDDIEIVKEVILEADKQKTG